MLSSMIRSTSVLLITFALVACGSQPSAQQPSAPAPSAAAPTAAPAATVAPQPTAVAEPTSAAVATAPTSNTTEGCVTEYDPSIDYFPEKLSLAYATGFTVEYFNNYKVVTVLQPYPEATEAFRYVLVQCGTPAPTDVGDAQVMELPVKSIAALSTVQFADLIRLELLDRLVAVQKFDQIYASEVLDLAQAGKLVEMGGGHSDVNMEVAINLQPGLIMTSASGDSTQWDHPKLLEVGLPVALHASWLEETPLGRAEWIKYMGVFFNKEARAEAIFSSMAARYEAIAAKARAATTKPKVFTGFTYKGSWYITGGNSYFARYLADAGADYIWSDDDSTGSPTRSFEEVFDRAKEADIWINGSQSWNVLADVLKDDERNAEFTAFQTGRIYNNNKRMNPTAGGNDYWQSGVGNPDVILADLIKIFHPELLPDHELVYFQQLQP